MNGIMLGIAIVILLIALFDNKRDDTDPPKGRSGLTLYTDNLTGCQYVKGGLFGGLTPRLDRDGKHVCKK